MYHSGCMRHSEINGSLGIWRKHSGSMQMEPAQTSQWMLVTLGSLSVTFAIYLNHWLSHCRCNLLDRIIWKGKWDTRLCLLHPMICFYTRSYWILSSAEMNLGHSSKQLDGRPRPYLWIDWPSGQAMITSNLYSTRGWWRRKHSNLKAMINCQASHISFSLV